MNRRNRLRRVALVLALLMLAAIVTEVAASATKTAIPEKLTGKWERDDGEVMVVGLRGKVNFSKDKADWRQPKSWYHTKFSHVTPNRLSISGPRSCSGTGTYRWWPTPFGFGSGYRINFKKIHDACKLRVGLMIRTADAYGRP